MLKIAIRKKCKAYSEDNMITYILKEDLSWKKTGT